MIAAISKGKYDESVFIELESLKKAFASGLSKWTSSGARVGEEKEEAYYHLFMLALESLKISEYLPKPPVNKDVANRLAGDQTGFYQDEINGLLLSGHCCFCKRCSESQGNGR